MKQKGFAPIIILLVIVVLAGLAGVYFIGKSAQTKPTTPPVRNTTNPYIAQLKTGITGRLYGIDDTGLGEYPLRQNSILILLKQQYLSFLDPQKEFFTSPLRDEKYLGPLAISLLPDKNGFYKQFLIPGEYVLCILSFKDDCVELKLKEYDVAEVNYSVSVGGAGIRCVQPDFCHRIEMPKMIGVITSMSFSKYNQTLESTITVSSTQITFSDRLNKEQSKSITYDQFIDLNKSIYANKIFFLDDSYPKQMNNNSNSYGITVVKGRQVKRIACEADSCPIEFETVRKKIEELWESK